MSFNTITLKQTKSLLKTNSSLPLPNGRIDAWNLINLINVKICMVYNVKQNIAVASYTKKHLQEQNFFKDNAQHLHRNNCGLHPILFKDWKKKLMEDCDWSGEDGVSVGCNETCLFIVFYVLRYFFCPCECVFT